MSDVFAPTLMPDEIKRDMCHSLLEEFGATSINVRSNGEMIHSCVLPWHDDSRPSASLNYLKLTYNCLACQSHGGLLWLIASCRGVDGGQARSWLDTRSGLGGSENNLDSLLTYLDALARAPAQSHLAALPKFSERVLEPWAYIYPGLTIGAPDLGIAGRGIPEENLVRARVGWDLEANRVVIPHFWQGDLVGWQSRRLCDDGSPKYLSTVDFPRDRTVYRPVVAEPLGEVVVVESPMSVLRHLHHLSLVATFGAAVTDEQVRLLKWATRVVLWLDNDEAGWRAVEGYQDSTLNKHVLGLAERLMPYTEVVVVDSDWHADAADLDEGTVADLVATAVPYAAWRRPTGALRCLNCRECHGGPCEVVGLANETAGVVVGAS